MVAQIEVEYDVYDVEGKKNTEKTSINFKVATTTSSYVVHRAMIHQLANRRQGTASTKTRSEVRGGGRKPYKQKGTGRARAGSNRSPLWKGGGVIFGPKPRSYAQKMNRKEWRLALRTLLYNKSNNIKIIETLSDTFNTVSTKQFILMLKTWNINLSEKILLILDNPNPNLYLSARNIPQVKTISRKNLNILDILNANILIMEKDAALKINEGFNE